MEIAIIIVLIVLNGVLAMSEIALVSARKSKLETEARRGSLSASTALKLSREPDRFLSTIQIGITLIGILTGLYSGEAFAHDLAGAIARIDALAPYSVTIAKSVIVVVVTYLTLVMGELLPKRIGMTKAECIAKMMARPMNILSRAASPLVWLLSKSTSLLVRVFGIGDDEESKVTEEEIKAIVKEGLDDGEVQEVEHDIVERVFSLGDRDVESIMTHRSDIVWLDVDDDKQTVRSKVLESMHDVYPAIAGSYSDMRGVVYLKDLFGKIDSEDFDLASLVRPPHFMSGSQSVYDALEQFKKLNVKYGFIIDEFGEILGVVTLKDIMEALVGQVNEDGEDKEITLRDDGTLLVDGQCSFYNFLEYFEMEYLYPDNDYNTLSGLILDLLHHIPHTGEKLSWEKFDLEIVDMDGGRIDKVLVSPRDTGAEGEK